MIEADEPVTREFIEEGVWEVEIVNRNYPATISIRPLYDPTSERVRM
jgi:4-methylaminobutanoate oxidase (formaldehyde-forming)